VIVERIELACDILPNTAPADLAVVNHTPPITKPAPDLPGICRLPEDCLSEIFRIHCHDTVPSSLSLKNPNRQQFAAVTRPESSVYHLTPAGPSSIYLDRQAGVLENSNSAFLADAYRILLCSVGHFARLSWGE